MQEIELTQIINLINQCMKYTFNFSLILLTSLLIIALVVWLIGIKIKSEKAIKMGIKVSITTLILNLLLIGIVVIVAYFKWKEEHYAKL